jgi:hypothetical protein
MTMWFCSRIFQNFVCFIRTKISSLLFNLNLIVYFCPNYFNFLSFAFKIWLLWGLSAFSSWVIVILSVFHKIKIEQISCCHLVTDTHNSLSIIVSVHPNHRHLSNIDCLMACTACLVCLISTVNGHSKKKRKKRLKMWR